MALRIKHLHPEFQGRSCKDCIRWIYEPDTGKVVMRGGQPCPRGAGQPTPCDTCPKVPDDAPVKSPDYAEEITDRSRLTLQHYAECRAVFSFPDDPIVRRNAAAIREWMDEYEKFKFQAQLQQIALIRTAQTM